MIIIGKDTKSPPKLYPTPHYLKGIRPNLPSNDPTCSPLWGRIDALCPQKVQETCIFQIINRAGKSVGQKGYELETSKFLFLSSFCSASKNSLFNICKDIKSTQDGMLDFEFIDSNFTA